MAPVNQQKFSHVQIPHRRSPEPDANHGKRHSWSRAHREALCLLFRLYKNKLKELTAIFNEMFSSELRNEGFTSGLRTSVFNTQWQDMRVGSNGNDIWVKIHKKLSLNEVRSIYRETRNSIEDTAIGLGIELCLRVQDPAFGLKHSTKITRKASQLEKIRSVLGETMSPEGWTDSAKERPKKRSRTRSAGNAHEVRWLEGEEFRLISSAPSGRVIADSTSRDIVARDTAETMSAHTQRSQDCRRRVPRLVYRFSNDKSQGFNGSRELRAGRFLGTVTTIPALPEGDELREEARAHLSLINRTSTPFISVFDDMLYALQRALADPPGEVNSRITVIDLQKVTSGSEERFGKEKESVFLVDDIRRRFKLDLEGGYHGKREWLIYGIVPKTAQAVVTSFRVDEVFPTRLLAPEYCSVLHINELRGKTKMGDCRSKLKARAKNLSKETGTAVGKLITTMAIKTPAHRELVATSIAKSWAFKVRGKREDCYAEYINGVFENVAGVCEPSIESVVLEKDLDVPWSDEEDVFQPASKHVTAGEASENDVLLPGRNGPAESNANHRSPLIAADSEDDNEGSNDVHISPSPEARGTSVNTFVQSVLQAAALRSPSAADIAHISNWQNWSSITPQPQHEATTSPMAPKSVLIVDLSNDTDDEDVREIEKLEESNKLVRKPVKVAGKNRQTHIMGSVKKPRFPKRGQQKVIESSHEDEVMEIPSVDLSGD